MQILAACGEMGCTISFTVMPLDPPIVVVNVYYDVLHEEIDTFFIPLDLYKKLGETYAEKGNTKS